MNQVYVYLDRKDEKLIIVFNKISDDSYLELCNINGHVDMNYQLNMAKNFCNGYMMACLKNDVVINNDFSEFSINQ